MANEFISKIGFIGFFVMAGFAGTIYFGSLLSPIIHPEKARTNYKVVPFDEAIRKYHGQPPRNFKLPKMPKTPEWRHFEFQ